MSRVRLELCSSTFWCSPVTHRQLTTVTTYSYVQCGLSSYFETLEFSCVLLYQTGSQIASTSASFSFPGLTGIITVQIPEPSKLLHIPVSQEVKSELAKSAHSAVAAWHPASLRPLAGGYVTGLLWVCDFFLIQKTRNE